LVARPGRRPDPNREGTGQLVFPILDATSSNGNLKRFSGFAELYDSIRPAPPDELAPLLTSYANESEPAVVDLGSGSGQSSRWASGWAESVVGIEPNADMRSVAESHDTPKVRYLAGLSHQTGLADRVADIVLVVQAMHWMDPEPTLAEVARLLRPGGVLAVVDADWPPVAGIAAAEKAWAILQRRMRVFEARAARGAAAEELRAPVAESDPAVFDENLHDIHKDRSMPGGVRSWPKSRHFDRMVASGHFDFVRELIMNQPADGGADRFVGLMRSQGSYQGLRRLGLSDEDLGADDFERTVHAAFEAARFSPGLSFSWRVRLGVTPS
jgi:SAM-dependent methyltransferase